MAPDRARMGELHEEFLAVLNGGRKSKASGSTWKDQADGRGNELTEHFAFAWDGKSTRGQSIAVSRDMITKIREQAASERPQLGLRFYGTDDLQQVDEDWIAIPAADYGELLAAARLSAGAEQALLEAGRISAEARDALAEAERQAHPLRTIRPDSLFTDPASPPALHGTYPSHLPPPPHEMWPCLVIDSRHGTDEPDSLGLESKGYSVAADGRVNDYGISSVRYDRGMGWVRLYVNDVVVRSGLLYIDGALRVRVGPPPTL